MQSNLLIALAMLMTLQSAAPNRAPRDFALRLEFGCSVPDVINTAAGTYEVYAQGSGRQTARIYVSSKLKAQLFTLITEQQFFSLNPRAAELGVCEPSTDYTLWVTANGKSHTVSWEDCHLAPTTDQGRRVRALEQGIVRPFHEMGAVKQLLRLPRYLCL